MDRSLWLLIQLRSLAWIRVWGKNLKTLKGALLALVGAFVFLPLFGSALFAPRVQTGAQLDAVRRYGALGLLVYCILNVMLSSGDRVVYYSPAEVNFLFSGPYRPRQLLLYKVAAGAGAGLITALLMACAFAPHSARFLSSYVGLFLILQLIHLFSMSVGLVAGTVGALAFSRGRQLLLVGVGLLIAAALIPLGRDLWALPPMLLVERTLHSPAMSAVTMPFRPFVMAYASERLWPDLVGWSMVALAVDLTFLGLVLMLNARFVEASASASVRIYDKIRRARRGEGWTGAVKARVSLPMLPWWGGIGPNLWRQLTSVSRSPAKLGMIAFLFMVPIVMILVVRRADESASKTFAPLIAFYVSMTFIASSTVGYDFRPDLGRMEDLKTLPIRPTRLVMSQLITPVLVLCCGQWLTLGAVAFFLAPEPSFLVATAALMAPANLILIAVENLYFLWYPYRTAGINSFDFQSLGRQFLLVLGKMATVGLSAGLSGGAGAVAYWIGDGSLSLTVAVAWLVALACGLGLVPLVALAFDQFDVAADRTE